MMRRNECTVQNIASSPSSSPPPPPPPPRPRFFPLIEMSVGLTFDSILATVGRQCNVGLSWAQLIWILCLWIMLPSPKLYYVQSI